MSISSKLNIDKHSWNACKYDISISLTFSNGTVRELKTTQIAGIFLEKNFDRDHLPIFNGRFSS